MVDQRGIEWLLLDDGTADDRALVADFVRSGDLRRDEHLLDFRIPTRNTRRGIDSESPDIGEIVALRRSSDSDVVVAMGVVVATFFDPRGRNGRSRSVGRAKLGRWRWR